MLATILIIDKRKELSIKYKKSIDVFSGKRITVEFDHPCALQIDGETVSDVTTYTAWID